MKKAGFNVYVYDFSVDYDATDVDDIIRHSQTFDEKKWHSLSKDVWIC